MEKVLKGRGIDTCEQREQHAADEEGDKVTITDLEQRDPLAESKHFGLTSPLLRWQRSPYRRRWRLTCTVSILLLLVVLLSVSRVSPSAMIESFRRATHHKHIPLTQVRVFLSFLSGMASLV